MTAKELDVTVHTYVGTYVKLNVELY